MVRAWYLDDSQADKRLSHQTNPPLFVSLEELEAKTAIEYFKIDADNYVHDELLQKIRKERNYSYEDLLGLRPDILPNYEEKVKAFFKEHIHVDEEIRMVVEGSGYFDARDVDDKWIRVEVVKGDMIILPAGIYHRFTMDTKNYIKLARYFIGEPVWRAHNRPADDLEARRLYASQMGIQLKS